MIGGRRLHCNACMANKISNGGPLYPDVIRRHGRRGPPGPVCTQRFAPVPRPGCMPQVRNRRRGSDTVDTSPALPDPTCTPGGEAATASVCKKHVLPSCAGPGKVARCPPPPPPLSRMRHDGLDAASLSPLRYPRTFGNVSLPSAHTIGPSPGAHCAASWGVCDASTTPTSSSPGRTTRLRNGACTRMTGWPWATMVVQWGHCRSGGGGRLSQP